MRNKKAAIIGSFTIIGILIFSIIFFFYAASNISTS